MTDPLVLKFGGTSVKDAAAMMQVNRIVAAAAAGAQPLVVVVSAMSGVTDALLSAAAAARDGASEDVERRLAALQARHREVVDELFEPRDAAGVWADVAHECDELRGVLTSVAVLQELTPRGSDRVAAAGELMSSRIVAALLRIQGVPARWVDARRAIVTDGGFGAALPQLEPTRVAVRRDIQPASEAGDVAVMGGFVGATAEGITTTLGRGGSDVSAAVIGAALNATEIQIWTDVDGMLTADPRVVADAKPVRRLSFDEAAELAYFGAKVLHPSTILPAIERNIPVRILNTMRPESPGSLITAERGGGRALTAIACKRNVTVVNVTSTRMLLAHGFLRQVFEVFERHTTSVDVVTTSEVSVSMTLDDDRRIDAIARDLAGFASVQVERGMAIVSAVGDQLRADPASAVSVIAALGRLPLRMVSQAASRRNVTVVLSDSDVPAAMTRLHAEFFAIVESVR
jgi:aspartate kinase